MSWGKGLEWLLQRSTTPSMWRCRSWHAASWPELANLHPFAPPSQAEGYNEMFKDLSDMLCEITGFDSMSLQPNSGASGEYAGLMAIREYHMSRGDTQRNVCIIPTSAHGTNPASAVMAGMKIVTTGVDSQGFVSIDEVRAAALRWALARGVRSGRTAQHFARHWVGKSLLD